MYSSPEPPPTPTDPSLRLIDREDWQTHMARSHQIGRNVLDNLRDPMIVSDIDDTHYSYQALSTALLYSDDRIGVNKVKDRISEICLDSKLQPAKKLNPFFEKSPDLGEDLQAVMMRDPVVHEFINSRDLSGAHRSLVEAWPSFVERYADGVREGIRQGYIPEDVEGRMNLALRKTSVQMADVAVMTVLVPGSEAVYASTKDQILVRQPMSSDEKDLTEPLAHEFTHKLSGGTFQENQHQPVHARPRTGFSSEVGFERVTRIGLNEAVTEHVTLGILTGDFETLDPNLRPPDQQVYAWCRQVLFELVARSGGAITTRLLTRSYFEDTDPTGGFSERRKLVTAFRDAYGPGALKNADELFHKAQFTALDQLNDTVLRRIHPPVVDKEGVILKPGYIDTKDLT